MFASRKLFIATKHGKEKVLSPLLEARLGVVPFTSNVVDTDLLGTFTGEIERVLSPLDAARQKCSMAYALTGCDLVVASEGSFGAHPVYGFVPADEELLLFRDFKHDVEIVQTHLSTNTNHNATKVNHADDLIEFAKQAGFPSHGLVLRKTRSEGHQFIKGITSLDALIASYHELSDDPDGELVVETDMRAMFNPTRMGVIAECAEKLVAKINSRCPACDFPGFSITGRQAGLPCQQCGLPTRSTLTASSTCARCSHTVHHQFPNGKTNEEPTYCDFCNP